MNHQDQLTLAERQIADTKQLISRQLEVLEQLDHDGKERKDAEKLLSSLVDSLGAYETFRTEILGRVQELS